MLVDAIQNKEILLKLDTIITVQAGQAEHIEAINRRFVKFESSFTFMHQKTGECLTYIKRLKPFIMQAMQTLHKAFKMVGNGILNLREEQSSFAGNIIDSEHDVRFV